MEHIKTIDQAMLVKLAFASGSIDDFRVTPELLGDLLRANISSLEGMRVRITRSNSGISVSIRGEKYVNYALSNSRKKDFSPRLIANDEIGIQYVFQKARCDTNAERGLFRIAHGNVNKTLAALEIIDFCHHITTQNFDREVIVAEKSEIVRTFSEERSSSIASAKAEFARILEQNSDEEDYYTQRRRRAEEAERQVNQWREQGFSEESIAISRRMFPDFYPTT